MGKHARLGTLEAEIEKLGDEWDYAAVDVDPAEKDKEVEVKFHYAGTGSSRYEPGEPGGSESYVFRQDWATEHEEGFEGKIKHKLLHVLWNGQKAPSSDVDLEFQDFVMKHVVPLLDAHFTREMY